MHHSTLYALYIPVYFSWYVLTLSNKMFTRKCIEYVDVNVNWIQSLFYKDDCLVQMSCCTMCHAVGRQLWKKAAFTIEFVCTLSHVHSQTVY